MQDQKILKIINDLKGRKNYEQKKAIKLGFSSLYAYLEDKTFIRMAAIISSMTKNEKANPSIINGSRKKRIAFGAGVEIQDVNKLLKQFKNMQLMMKKISKHGMDGMEKMLSNNIGTNNLGNMLHNLRRK